MWGLALLISFPIAYLFPDMTRFSKQKIQILTASALLGGLIHWPLPYNNRGWELFLFGGWSLGVVFIAAISMILTTLRVRDVIFSAGFGPAIANFLRVLFDTTFIDPTSHNLFPFEIAFAVMLGIAAATVGSWLGRFLRKPAADRQ